MSTGPEGVWLRTNEIDEFVTSLAFCAEIAVTRLEDINQWKWLVIALHIALQGAFVCALRGRDTTGIAVLDKKSGKRMWEWLDVTSRTNPRAPAPEEKLARMLELYSRAKNPEFLPNPHCLESNSEMDWDVEKLNSIRNEFIHFVPKGWSLEMSGMPRIVRNCCDIIDHLAILQPTFDHHMRDEDSVSIKASIADLRQTMNEWENSFRNKK